ncbi:MULTISPECIES: GGDEF domain-containing protein [Arsenicicoccus]|uniref:Diguanylate cyclase n=1 Tax=Arsenicicoccus bolidensis TaxID=229480 RepID=A0ABS9Q2V1_9MICO|nr:MULTISPECIES: GGDEF domain-containing protein [Arsenicicoccus]MCG7322210.1 diguanylate cyclase [Arsenicicoccus bolidensis]
MPTEPCLPRNALPVPGGGPAIDHSAMVERAWHARHRDQETASALADRAARHAVATDDHLLEARARVVQAACRFAVQDYEQALTLANEGLVTLTSLEDVWLGRLQLVLGNVSAEIGEPAHAAGFFNQAVSIARQANDVQLVAQCLLNAALDRVDVVDQVRDFRRALAIFEGIDDAEGQAYAHLDIAHALVDQQRLLEATVEARRAQHHAARAHTNDVVAHAVALQAYGSAHLGHPLQAEALLADAQHRIESARQPVRIDVTIEVARAWTALGRPDEAVLLLEPLLTRSALTDRQTLALTDILSEAYAGRGDHESAYWTLRSHLELKDAHEDAMARRRASALVVLHRVQMVEREAARARERQQRLEAEFSELKSEHRMVQEISIRDDLTGLHNRRLLNDRLRVDVRAADADHPVSLILLDLDHFKRVNDTHGHVVGDQVLHALGRMLQTEVRVSDVAARYGGEELAVLQPGTDLDAATVLAERLRARIAALDWLQIVGVPLNLTVSAGVASTSGGETPRDLLRRADRAMYAAKAAGRDRVMTAADTT